MSGYTADGIAHQGGCRAQGVLVTQKPFSAKELGAKVGEVPVRRGSPETSVF